MSASDGDDDYMSPEFLQKINDVKPGVGSTRSSHRVLSIDSRREEAEHRDRKKITRKNVDDLARARIEEGLNQPICNKSKGFLLLSKMGYKPGMSLGVNRNGDEGIKDPISIDLRNGRAGIGKNTIPKNPSNFSDTVPKQSEANMIHEFRTSRQNRANQKLALSDLFMLRKTCQELDTRLKKDYPEKDWYWPIYHSSTDGIDCADYIANDEEPETKRPKNVSVPTKTSPVSSETFIYYNGHNAPEEIDYRQLSLDQLNSMSSDLIDYLRSTYSYCIFCGSTFDDMDASGHCPGPLRADHDNY